MGGVLVWGSAFAFLEKEDSHGVMSSHCLSFLLYILPPQLELLGLIGIR